MYSRHAEQSMRGLPAQRFSGETRVVRRGAVHGRRNPVRRGAVQFLQARSVEERPFSIGTMTSVRNRTMCYLPKATGSRRSGRARSRLALPRHRSLPDPRRSRTVTFTLEYVRGGRLGRSSAVRGVARQSPVVAGGLAWKVTPDRDGSFRPLIEMCSRTCRCVKVCRRNHPDEPTAHGRTVWTKRSG